MDGSGLCTMNAELKTELSVPARDSSLATILEPGSTTPLAPAAASNGDTASSAWWAHIQALDHYDPNYPYDPRHIYGPDWTDDDAYGKDGVTFMAAPYHRTSINGCFDEAQRLLGFNRVFSDRCLKLPDLGVPRTNRYARSGQVMPDVFIQKQPRPDDNRHEVAYDPDNPILFVLEVLSESTFHHDLGPKVEIYRAMGVREYFLYDPEHLHRREDKPRLWGLRLSTDGEYKDIELLRMADELPVYRSEVLGTFRMLDEGGDIHTFQTWDEARGVWLDPVRARGLAADEATQEAVQDTTLTTSQANFLSQLKLRAAQGELASHAPDTLAMAWRRARWVPDAADILNVLIGASDWSTLMPPEDG